MYINKKDSISLNKSRKSQLERSSTPDGKGGQRKSILNSIDVHRSFEEFEKKISQIKDNNEISNLADKILPEDEKKIILNSENDKKNSIKKSMNRSKKEIQNFLSQLKETYNIENESFQEKLPFLKKKNLLRFETNNLPFNALECHIENHLNTSPKKRIIHGDINENHRKSNTMLDLKMFKESKITNEKNNFILDKTSPERSYDNSGFNNLIDSYNNFLNFDNISSKPLKNDLEKTNLDNRRISKSSNLSGEDNTNNLTKNNNKPINISESFPLYNNYFNDLPKEIDNTRVLYKFKNVYDSYSDEEIDIPSEDNKMFMIHPNSTFKVFWDISLLLSIIYSTIFSPFRIAFNLDDSQDILYYFEALIDVIFIIDLAINFFIPYYDHEENLVWNLSKVRTKYLQSWFFLDLISSYPSYLISIIIGRNVLNSYFSDLNFSNIYRFMKWIRMTRFSKIGKAHFIEVIFPNFSVSNNDGVNRAVKFSIFLIVLVHISSCFWIFLGRANFEKTWITNANLQDSNISEIYITSLYFNLVTIFSIGYGDIISTNITEKFYNSMYMIVGTFLFSFTISCFSTIFGKMDEKKMLIKKKLEMLHKFENEFVIPNELISKIRKTIKHQIKKNNADRYKLLDELTNNLRNELNLIMNKENIKNLYFFKSKPHDFLIYVIPLLKSIITAKGEPLFSEGEYVEEMYFVVKGRLSIQLGQLYDYINLGHILKNQHFGEILMYTNQHSPYNLLVKTTISDILVLKKSDFSKMKISFNEIISELLAESIQLLEQIEKRKNVIHLLYSYDNSVGEIRRMIIKLNNYILEKDFDKYYYQDNSFCDAMEILENDHSEDLKKLIFKGKSLKNKRLGEINQSFLEKIVKDTKNTEEPDPCNVLVKKKKDSVHSHKRNSNQSKRKNIAQIYDGGDPSSLGSFDNIRTDKSISAENLDPRKMLYITNSFKDKIINENKKNSTENAEINSNIYTSNDKIPQTNNQININLYNYESNLNQRFIIYQNQKEDISYENSGLNKINVSNQPNKVQEESLNNISFKDNNNLEFFYKDTLNEKDAQENESKKEEDHITSFYHHENPKFLSDVSKDISKSIENKEKSLRPSITKCNTINDDKKKRILLNSDTQNKKIRPSIDIKNQPKIFKNILGNDKQQVNKNSNNKNNQKLFSHSDSIQKILKEIDLDAATNHVHNHRHILNGIKDFIDENEEQKLNLSKSIRKLDKIMRKLLNK